MRAATKAALERMKAIPSDELLAIGAEYADGDISEFLRATARHANADYSYFSSDVILGEAMARRTIVLKADVTLTHNAHGDAEDKNAYLLAVSYRSWGELPVSVNARPQREMMAACNTPIYQDVEMLAA